MEQHAKGPELRSVNVGVVETLEFDGRAYRTAFRKKPAAGRIAVESLGLTGDHQANKKVHGGPDQAVYAYPLEHYAPWETELGVALEAPSFGENLVVEGLLESEVEIGDRLEVGSTVFEVSQPRLPCAMLSVVHGRKDMTKRFGAAPRPGFYLRVLQPGDVGGGDMVIRQPGGSGVSVLEVYENILGADFHGPRVEAMLSLEALGSGVRSRLERLLASRTTAGT